MVNGKVVKKHILQHGDVIEVGKYQLKYANEATVNAATSGNSADDFEKTMIFRPSAMKAASADEQVKMQSTSTQVPAAAPAPVPAPIPAPSLGDAAGKEAALLARIQVLSGPSAGKELLLNKALVTLGKPGVQVAVITRRPQGYFITHVEGQNHPVINGISVGAQAHPLNDHDVIELAGVKMEFYLTTT
jgi:hypothetical protein